MHVFSFYYVCINDDNCIFYYESLFYRLKVVLRVQCGDEYIFFDKSFWSRIVITEVDKKVIRYKVIIRQAIEKRKAGKLIAYVPILETKYLAEVVYLLGKTFTSEIFFVETALSRKRSSIIFDKLQQCIIQGAEESKNFEFPCLNKKILLLEELREINHHILFCYEKSAKKLGNMLNYSFSSDLGFFCGPEQGFKKEEVEFLLSSNNMIDVSLHQAVLKSIDVLFHVAIFLSMRD